MTDRDLYSRASVLAQASERAMLGEESQREELEQAKVMFEAIDIYVEREETRSGLWKQDGLPDSAHHLKSKAARLIMTLSRRADSEVAGDNHFEHEVIDSALDAINYAAFAVRNWREGRR